jgi:hypothetical protein
MMLCFLVKGAMGCMGVFFVNVTRKCVLRDAVLVLRNATGATTGLVM